MKITDIKLLNHAIDFYNSLGVEFIELPWIVDEKYSLVTKPPHKKDFFVNSKVLVASGEQSFLEKMCNNELIEDKIYMGITPCFRDETEDKIHKSYFTKLELFCVSNDKNKHKTLLEYAHKFMSEITENPLDIVEVNTNSTDIVSYNGVELGSYLHHCEDISGRLYSWSCGTGLAVPRIYNANNYDNN